MLKISSGKSDRDRISLYTANNGATAIRRPSGEIITVHGTSNINLGKSLLVLVGIFGFNSLIKAIVIVPLIRNGLIAIGWYLITAFFCIFIMMYSVVGIRKIGGKELLKNHGAEHEVILAYNKLRRLPTIEEVSKFSRINQECGVTIFSTFITV